LGYWRLRVLLKREGLVINHKRVYRIYAEERLTVRQKKQRTRAPGHAKPTEEGNPQAVLSL